MGPFSATDKATVISSGNSGFLNRSMPFGRLSMLQPIRRKLPIRFGEGHRGMFAFSRS